MGVATLYHVHYKHYQVLILFGNVNIVLLAVGESFAVGSLNVKDWVSIDFLEPQHAVLLAVGVRSIAEGKGIPVVLDVAQGAAEVVRALLVPHGLKNAVHTNASHSAVLRHRDLNGGKKVGRVRYGHVAKAKTERGMEMGGGRAKSCSGTTKKIRFSAPSFEESVFFVPRGLRMVFLSMKSKLTPS